MFRGTILPIWVGTVSGLRLILVSLSKIICCNCLPLRRVAGQIGHTAWSLSEHWHCQCLLIIMTSGGKCSLSVKLWAVFYCGLDFLQWQRYDKDGNCEPCCLRGHKAHWAVITGFLLQCKRHDLQGLHTTQMYQDLDILNLYHISSGNTDEVNEHDIQMVHAILHRVPTSDVYVLARQGKSRHAHSWRYCTLADSNRNLTELGDNIEADIERYVIPEGGIQAGLCGQVVLLKP